MLIISLSGFSASVRRKPKTLAGFVGDVIGDMGDDRPAFIRRLDLYSSSKNCIFDALDIAIERNNEPILFIGKSMGAVKLWWMLTERWVHFKYRNAKIAFVLLDAHGWQIGDGVFGSYGKKKNLKWDPRWTLSNVRARVIYQRNRYPRGAHFTDVTDGADIEQVKLGKGATHWNITDIKSEHGRVAADKIQDSIKWLTEG